MRSLVIGVALLAVVAPGAYAQESGRATTDAVSTQVGPGHFRVFFAFDSATLSPSARQVVAEAAQSYRNTGTARVTVTGYTDRAGTVRYNQALSERRARAVERELVRVGVPGSAITTIGEGENNPLVATADGVPEARNRRVEIEIPQPTPAPAPPPVAAVPAPAPAPVETMPMQPAPVLVAPPRWTIALGPFYGYNFKENDESGNHRDHLGGVEGRVEYLLHPNLPISLEQSGWHTFKSDDDGYGGRTAIGINFQGNAGPVHPYIGANFGGVYGKGVQDGLIAGPEAGLKIDLARNFFLYGKAGYDYQFRNKGWDEGIIIGGLGVGVRF